MMIANTKAAFSVQPSLVPSSFFNETFFFSSSLDEKSRACAEVNNVQDEWQRTVETKSTFLKSTPTQFQALSPREISRRAEGSQWLHIHSQAVEFYYIE